jgi:3-oxoacyl-[acyl-carrier protein] reductase
MRLKDRVALVTGGGSGIGRAICLAFASEGARVIVNDVNDESIAGTIAQMGEIGGNGLAANADVSDSSKVKQMFTAALDHFGTLDILVNNAGIGEVSNERAGEVGRIAEQQIGELMSGGPVKTFWEVTQNLQDEEWDRMLRVHLYGTFYCSREALKIMEPKGRGKIVNMSSVAGTMGLEGSPHYSAAKAGILGFTRSLSREVGMRGINVNAICPGLIETPMTELIPPLLKQLWIANTPMRRSGEVTDIAAAALYLASDESNFVTGQILSPNGGTWMP